MRRIRAADIGIVPKRDCWVEWGAMLASTAAHYAATGEPTVIELEHSEEYWTQHHAGSGAIVGGYTGWQMVSGLHIEGCASTVRNMPLSEGGKPGQVLGVRHPAADVVDIGLRGITVLNDTGFTDMRHHHAIWFHSTRGTISGIQMQDVHVIGSTSGDGVYFGTQCSDVDWAGGSVNGCKRHSVTLAGVGANRSGYRISNLFMGAPQGGSAFHIESDVNHQAAYELLATDPTATPEALTVALEALHDVELWRCFFEGNATFNGVGNWRVIECGSRPRDGSHGGSLVATNAPGGQVVRSTIVARERGANNTARAMTLIGGITSVELDQCTIHSLSSLDGSEPPVIYSRQYTQNLPGLPRDVRFTDCLGTSSASAVLVQTAGPGWDLTGLRHATWS